MSQQKWVYTSNRVYTANIIHKSHGLVGSTVYIADIDESPVDCHTAMQANVRRGNSDSIITDFRRVE